MRNRHGVTILALAVFSGACDQVVAPEPDSADVATLAVTSAMAPSHITATGDFTQTGITDIEVRSAGPNTIIQQTSTGVLTGTLSGDFEDDLKVVIHPNGRFTTHFTITCVCTVNGRQGVIEMVADDTGELISPTVASFAGRAVITDATGELSGLRGNVAINGSVDLPSGLSTYSYTGRIQFRP
jgi:hypothetical protein